MNNKKALALRKRESRKHSEILQRYRKRINRNRHATRMLFIHGQQQVAVILFILLDLFDIVAGL